MKFLFKLLFIFLLTTQIADAKLCSGDATADIMPGVWQVTNVSWAIAGDGCCNNATGVALVMTTYYYDYGYGPQVLGTNYYYIDISEAQYAAGCYSV